MALYKITPKYYKEVIEGAVKFMRENHNRMILTNPDYRAKQEALMQEYDKIFNSKVED